MRTGMIARVSDVPYTELAPPRDLAAYVDRFWVKRARAPREQRVLPDGCVDLLVHVGAERSELVGPMTRALVVPGGPSHVVAVRFKPGAAARFAGVALEPLADEHVDVAEVGLSESEIVDSVCGAADVRASVRALEVVVRRRLERAEPPDRLVRRAVIAIRDLRASTRSRLASASAASTSRGSCAARSA